jgi:hypothetical protein
VLPYLRLRGLAAQAVLRRRILRTFGIGESTIDHRLGELLRRSNPTVGLAAHTGQVRHPHRRARRRRSQRRTDARCVIEAEVRERAGDFIYSTTPGESYESVLEEPVCRAAGVTLALLETNTRKARWPHGSAAAAAHIQPAAETESSPDDGALPDAMLADLPDHRRAQSPATRQALAREAATWLKHRQRRHALRRFGRDQRRR